MKRVSGRITENEIKEREQSGLTHADIKWLMNTYIFVFLSIWNSVRNQKHFMLNPLKIKNATYLTLMSVQLNPYKKYIIVTLQITRFQKVNIKDDKQQQILYFSSCYQLH